MSLMIQVWVAGGFRQVTIAEAVALDTQYESERGVVEDAAGTARQAGEKVGALVQLLYERGVIAKDKLSPFVGWGVEYVEVES